MHKETKFHDSLDNIVPKSNNPIINAGVERAVKNPNTIKILMRMIPEAN
jgi:hypothetical protein